MSVQGTAEAPAPRSAPGGQRTIVHSQSDREPTLLRALADASIGWQSYVVVDLGDTPMVSAAVLAALRRLGSCLRARGGELTVRSSNAAFTRLVELTLLTFSFELEKTTPGRQSLTGRAL